EMLSLAAPDLRDLRIVQNGSQLPYFFPRTSGSMEISPQWRATNLPDRATVSGWHIVLPFENVPVNRLTARIETKLFQRPVLLFGLPPQARDNADRPLLGQANWTHSVGDGNVLFSI